MRNSLPGKSCCHTWEINWNGRFVNDVVCAIAGTEADCQTKIKLLKATLYQMCFKDGLKQSVDAIIHKGLDLKGS